MERFIKSKLLKVVTVITILFAMFAAYLPAITNADNETTLVDYVIFKANNANVESVVSDTQVAFTYNWKLSGVPTGFKNVKLTVMDMDTNEKPTASIYLGDENKYDERTTVIENQSNGRYSTATYGNVSNGTDFSGTAKVTFKKKAGFEEYQKTITFVFEADYKDPIEGITKRTTMQDDVTVTVQPSSEKDSFSANVNMGINKYDPGLIGTIDGIEFKKFDSEDHLGVHYAYYNSKTNYAIDRVAASYNVRIDAENVCYGQYRLRLEKSKEFEAVATEDINSEENLKIDLSRVPDIFNKEIVRNADGTTDIILTYKTKKDSYTIEDMDSTGEVFNYDFNIVVMWNIKYSYTLVVPKTVTKTLSQIESETSEYERISSSVNKITNGDDTYTGCFNAVDCKSQVINEDGTVTESYTYAEHKSTETPDRPYFTIMNQISGYLDNIKVASINALNGLRLAEGNTSEQTTGKIKTSLVGYNSSESENGEVVESSEESKVVYTDNGQITETMRTKTVQINETTDQLLTELGSWVTLTGSYNAETEGIDIVTDKTGVSVSKKSSTYTNSSTCKFLSASSEGKVGAAIYGKDQQVNQYLESLNNNNAITATFNTEWTIKETDVFEEGQKPALYVVNYNPAIRK